MPLEFYDLSFVKRALWDSGLTVKSLADAMHVPPTRLSAWLSGYAKISQENIDKIEMHLLQLLTPSPQLNDAILNFESLIPESRPPIKATGRKHNLANLEETKWFIRMQGLKMSQVAAELGMHQSAFSAMCRPGTPVPESRMDRLFEILQDKLQHDPKARKKLRQLERGAWCEG